MRGNLVLAAAVFAVGLVVASLLFAWGLDRAAGRLEAAVASHGAAVERAGNRVGGPAEHGLDELADAVAGHAVAIRETGKVIANPLLRIQDPIAVQQPVTIQGPREDGGLPVNARVAK